VTDDLKSMVTPLVGQVHSKPRVAGTAIYMYSLIDVVPVPLLHNLKHNRVLHEGIVLHVVTPHVPRVLPDKRLEVAHIGDNSTPSSPNAALCRARMFRGCCNAAVSTICTTT
jgi:K+ transporter